MNFSDDFIAELKSRVDIEELISGYVNLQRKGKNLMGLCPFHAERTPSFCVYPANGSFYCFGCGCGGDIITFLRMTERYDYVEAVKFLAEKAGMEVQISPEENEAHQKKITVYQINRDSAKFYHNYLMGDFGAKARNYLIKRGISVSSVKRFGLGYSPDSRYSLVDYLKKRGYNEKDIVLSNLAFESRSGKIIDRFFGRLMFPIIDLRGNVIGFGGRALGAELPKYINTSDTIVFKKSSNLFALNFAKKSQENRFILTEGYMDVVSLHQAGFTNAVAALGTALTPEQVKLMARYCDEVVVSYDSDEPGQKAAARAITLLKSNGLEIKVLTLPKAKDPDEYIRSHGKDGSVKFGNLINNSKNDVEYNLEKAKSGYNLENAEDKIKYLTQAAKILAECENPIEREVYAIKLSSEIGVGKSSVLLQIDKYIRQKFKRNAKKEIKNIQRLTSALNDKVNTDKHQNLRASCAEESLISYIINNPDTANNIFLRVPHDLFATEFNKKVYDVIQKIVSENRVLDITNILAQNFSFEESGRITKMLCTYTPALGTEKFVGECIDILKQEHSKNKFKNPSDISESEIQKYINDLKSIKK